MISDDEFRCLMKENGAIRKKELTDDDKRIIKEIEESEL